jgi:methylmalonyl-CoA/ethylmalonyl-CoA epimerase
MKSPIAILAVALLIGTASASEAPLQNPLRLQAHHITASVIDIDRAVKWYQDMLGFTLLERGTRQNGNFKFAELKIPGFGVALVQVGNPAPSAANRVIAPPDWVHIVFTVPDPDATFKLLKTRGADVFLRPGQPTSPIREFLMHDSEGNEIEIFPASPRTN